MFGVDMTEDTIPLEAGIEDRAISFTKGCYVGQEIVIRVLHRGGGRVARRLVGLRIDGAVPQPGARSSLPAIATSGSSPARRHHPTSGAIALGYVHRDFTVTRHRASPSPRRRARSAATVTERPMPSAA